MEHAAGNILNNIMETIADGVQQHNPEIEEQNTASARVRKLFGRQKTIHKILGGGQCMPLFNPFSYFLFLNILLAQMKHNFFLFDLLAADVLLWRNKKISSSVLTCATVIWVLFEWLNYHFLTLIAFALFLGMLIQFAWSSASVVLNRYRFCSNVLSKCMLKVDC